MPHTIDSNTCEGVAACASACPVGCIKKGTGKNAKGTDYYFIQFDICIDCGVCLEVCPVPNAVIPEEKSNLQINQSL